MDRTLQYRETGISMDMSSFGWVLIFIGIAVIGYNLVIITARSMIVINRVVAERRIKKSLRVIREQEEKLDEVKSRIDVLYRAMNQGYEGERVVIGYHERSGKTFSYAMVADDANVQNLMRYKTAIEDYIEAERYVIKTHEAIVQTYVIMLESLVFKSK